VLEAAGPLARRARRRLSPNLAPDRGRPSPSFAGLGLEPERSNSRGAVRAWPASEYLQQHPIRAQRFGACSGICAPRSSSVAAGGTGRNPCGIRPVVRLGPLAIGDQAASRTNPRLNPAKLWWAGSNEAWGNLRAGAPLACPPTGSGSIAELLADPHRHNWKSGLQNGSQAEARGRPTPGGGAQPAPMADPRRFQLLGGTTKASAWPRAWGGCRRRESEQQAPGLPWPESSCGCQLSPESRARAES